MLLDELRDGIFAKDAAGGWRRQRTDITTWTSSRLERRRDIILGSQVATDRRNKVRYVDLDAWDPPNLGCTNAELARAYLNHCRQRYLLESELHRDPMTRKRIPWKGTQELALHAATPPIYYAGGALEGEWAYVDIDACYASLYLPVGLAPDFRHDPPVLGVSSLRFDRPLEWLEAKGPRNALVGVCSDRGHELQWFDHGEMRVERTVNRYYSPSLVAWCLWTARAIAQDMIKRFGFVSWATDGGMVPIGYAAAAIDHLRKVWGLSSSVRCSGTGTVYHPTNWELDSVATAHTVRIPSKPIDLGPRLPVEWYRDKLRWARTFPNYGVAA